MTASEGKVWLVGAGPGDPALITVRGRELLASASVVLYDALAHPGLLEECDPRALLVSVGKRLGAHTVSQDEIIRMMIDYALKGHLVVRLKGGDPFLFARGAEEAEALARAGISFGVVPGICSPVGTATYAGFSLTHRDLSSSVTFVTGTDKHGKPLCADAWARLANVSDTLCILMGMRRLEGIAEALIAGGRAPDTKVAVVHWGARPEQRVLIGTLRTIASQVHQAGLTNPSVIVVGDVVGLRDTLRWYDISPLFGRRMLVCRAFSQARDTARAIRLRGAIPITVPLLSIEEPLDPVPLRVASASLHSYDWVVLTSANGAERLLSVLAETGRDARAFGSAKIAVIGPKTAEPLRRAGLIADLVADEHIAEALAEKLLACAPVKRVLLVRAAEAREVLPERLRDEGVEVDVIAAYRTKKLSDEAREPLRKQLLQGHIDAVLLTSSSMAKSLVEALGDDAQRLLSNTRVCSIGPVTSATLAELGIKVDVVARTYTIEGLLDAVAARLEVESC